MVSGPKTALQEALIDTGSHREETGAFLVLFHPPSVLCVGAFNSTLKAMWYLLRFLFNKLVRQLTVF